MSLDNTVRMVMESSTLGTIQAAQNPDGGWPYRRGGSWTEPTVYALLAHYAGSTRNPGADRAVAWLCAAQRADGGWPPRPSVAQSTWVTALVALLPPDVIGAERHARAVGWLLEQSGMESTTAFRLREFLLKGEVQDGPEQSGWSWFPGTAAWVTPTCLGILALKKCYWRKPAPELRERIEAAQAYLFSRRCADGGWNHGAARALGYNSAYYPETTGQALLALAGTDPEPLRNSFELARGFLRECRPSGGVAWLRLGLLAHQQLSAGTPTFSMPCHTLLDVALRFLATKAEEGRNVFLD